MVLDVFLVLVVTKNKTSDENVILSDLLHYVPTILRSHLIHTDHVVSEVLEVFDFVELDNSAAEFACHFFIHYVHEVEECVYRAQRSFLYNNMGFMLIKSLGKHLRAA